jgi:hypothetical protein
LLSFVLLNSSLQIISNACIKRTFAISENVYEILIVAVDHF